MCFGELYVSIDMPICYAILVHDTLSWGKTVFFLRLDDEYLEVPQSTEVAEGAVVTLRCVHRFGWSYTWRSNRRYITRTDSKVS